MTRHIPYLASVALLAAFAVHPLAAADDKLERKLERSREVFEALLDLPDRKVPKYMLEDSECIAIIPAVIKGAIGWGGRHGRGVVSCRNHRGKWSPPAFVKISGGSVGLQIGAQSTDFVLFFMTERSIRSLLESKFILGGDVSVAAGPVGRSAEGATDAKLNAEILAYAKSRGLFAGVSLEGARLAVDQKAIERYYGQRIWPEKILFDHQVPGGLSGEAKRLLKALP